MLGSMLSCIVVLLQLFSVVQTAVISDDKPGIEDVKLVSDYQLLVICVSSVVVLCLAVLVIFQCGDCYNSEVSSTNHPACSTGQQSDGHKWGGGDGYTSGYGEIVNLDDRAAPSYAMIQSNVNSQSGFHGYSMTSGPSAGNYNPVTDGEAPPPPYSAGNRQATILTQAITQTKAFYICTRRVIHNTMIA